MMDDITIKCSKTGEKIENIQDCITVRVIYSGTEAGLFSDVIFFKTDLKNIDDLVDPDVDTGGKSVKAYIDNNDNVCMVEAGGIIANSEYYCRRSDQQGAKDLINLIEEVLQERQSE